jgi:hypothetical protein
VSADRFRMPPCALAAGHNARNQSLSGVKSGLGFALRACSRSAVAQRIRQASSSRPVRAMSLSDAALGWSVHSGIVTVTCESVPCKACMPMTAASIFVRRDIDNVAEMLMPCSNCKSNAEAVVLNWLTSPFLCRHER